MNKNLGKIKLKLQSPSVVFKFTETVEWWLPGAGETRKKGVVFFFMGIEFQICKMKTLQRAISKQRALNTTELYT